MNLLKRERETLKTFLPSMDTALAEFPLMVMEKQDNPSIALFRELGGTGLLIPTMYTGLGATPLQALHVQCAIANRAPSLAIASTMHHFSLATIVEMVMQKEGSGLEGILLEAVAKQHLYVASGFAEGRSGTGILSSAINVERTSEGLLLNGSKKPCSLSLSMNLLTASLVVPRGDHQDAELAVAIIPADTPGIERRPFWKSPILAGAESDEVVLHNVLVPENLISYLGSSGAQDHIQARGFLWFELLISASYLGIGTALVERVMMAGKGNESERTLLVIEVEGAMTALEGVARSMMEETIDSNSELARALYVRYAVQRAIERFSAHAVELLGGMAFVGSPEVAYLYSAARGLAFHPPSRVSISASLDKYQAGASLVIE